MMPHIGNLLLCSDCVLMDHILTSSECSQNWGSIYAWKKALYTLKNNVTLRKCLILKLVFKLNFQ